MSSINTEITKKLKQTRDSHWKMFFNKKSNKVFGVIATITVIISAVFGVSFWNMNNNPNQEARADDDIVSERRVAPGEKIEITYWYFNIQGRDTGDTLGNLTMSLGSVFDVERIYESFDVTGNAEFDYQHDICVEDFARIASPPPGFPTALRMNHTPRSTEAFFAENPDADCMPGKHRDDTELQPVELPQGEEVVDPESGRIVGGFHFGKIVVEATLKTNITDYTNTGSDSWDKFSIGDILNSDNNQFAVSLFTTQAGSTLNDPVRSIANFIISGQFIEPSNIVADNTVCIEQDSGNSEVLIGNIATCTFQLAALTSGEYYAIPKDFSVLLGDADESVGYENCRILDNNTLAVRIECNNIPTNGATANPEAPVSLTGNGETGDVGTINLIEEVDLTPPDEGVTLADGTVVLADGTVVLPDGTIIPISDSRLIITEINWAGSSVSKNDQWIELKNIGDSEVDLSDFVIAGVGNDANPDIRIKSSPDSSFSSGQYNRESRTFNEENESAGTCINRTVAPGEYFLIAGSTNTSVNTLLNIEVDCFFNVQTSIDLTKAGKDIAIYSSQGSLLDRVSF